MQSIRRRNTNGIGSRTNRKQIAFASIIDIHGVRDYLAPQKNRSTARNEAKEDLRNEVYEVLTGMKPKYHKNTITGEWVDIAWEQVLKLKV